jgi:hypothetical protein
MYKRASALVKAKIAQCGSTVTHRCETLLPEAPASVNVHVTLHGRQVQVTLRDTDEHHLLERLEKLLQRFPVEDTKPEPPEGWCSKHSVQMKHKRSEKGSWWYHKTAEGWCHGK